MFNKILFVLILIILIFTFPFKVSAINNLTEQSALLKKSFPTNQEDSRVEVLKKFLEKYNSPLSIHSEFIVHVADAYRIPWYLLPAISGVESTFCQHIPQNSYNCWGWNNGATHFNDFEDAIYNVTKGLKSGYFDRNLIEPYSIGPVYAPPSKTWAGKVILFSKQIKSFVAVSPIPDFSL